MLAGGIFLDMTFNYGSLSTLLTHLALLERAPSFFLASLLSIRRLHGCALITFIMLRQLGRAGRLLFGAFHHGAAPEALISLSLQLQEHVSVCILSFSH